MSFIRKNEETGHVLRKIKNVAWRKRTVQNDKTLRSVEETAQKNVPRKPIPRTKLITQFLEAASQTLKSYW
jgi:hypothetical protein